MSTRSTSGGSTAERAVPIYARLASDLMAQIASGVYPVGSFLPKEVDLSAQYGVSRHTVREALRRLHATGLVSRRRRAGTAVLVAKPISFRQPVNSVDDLLQYAEGTEVRVLGRSRVVCDGLLASTLDCAVGREWLLVETCRNYPNDPRPICLTRNYLNLDLVTIEDDIENLSGPISALIEQRYGLVIDHIEQSIQAVALGKRDAGLLLAKPGAPALQAVRRYYDADVRLLEHSVALHVGDRFTYVTRLRREKG